MNNNNHNSKSGRHITFDPNDPGLAYLATLAGTNTDGAATIVAAVLSDIKRNGGGINVKRPTE